LNHALYRFESRKLGPHFQKAIEFFDDWIGQDIDQAGTAFAKERVKMADVADYHKQCFDVPDTDKMLALEQRKKLHKSKHDRLRFLFEEHDLFYNLSSYKQEEIAYITEDSKWAWRAAALFSMQFSGSQKKFRDQINGILEQDEYLSGRVSGTFWYPPNAIREWHTNAWDVHTNEDGTLRKPWRMYFVRQKPVTPGDDTEDKSALHLVDGNGITSDRLEAAGGYRLSNYDDGRPNVWRIPDQDGYVNLFRLQTTEPYRWHCIVADDTVHRYSLGLSLSDDDVENLLKHVGEEL